MKAPGLPAFIMDFQAGDYVEVTGEYIYQGEVFRVIDVANAPVGPAVSHVELHETPVYSRPWAYVTDIDFITVEIVDG